MNRRLPRTCGDEPGTTVLRSILTASAPHLRV